MALSQFLSQKSVEIVSHANLKIFFTFNPLLSKRYQSAISHMLFNLFDE